MELAFALTPGLSTFMSLDREALVGATSEATLFYSVTVLSLLGHIPLSAYVGLCLVQRKVLDVENSITFAALFWLFLSLTSVAMMISLVVTSVPFFIRAFVVVAIVLGSVVRLTLISALPYAFFTNGDPLFTLVWWWLLCGLDWPGLSVSMSVLPEFVAIVVAAQAVYRTAWDGQASGASVVMIAPMVLRASALSDALLIRILVPLLGLFFFVYSFATVGLAFDFNRVLTGWNTAGSVVFDDVEKGE